jgi:hypothetical protein
MPAGDPISFRLSTEAVRILKDLERTTGLRRTAVVELALRRLHRAEAGARQKSAKAPAERG